MPMVLKIKIGCYGNHSRAQCKNMAICQIFLNAFLTLLHLPRVTMGTIERWGGVVLYMWVFMVCESVKWLVHKGHLCEFVKVDTSYISNLFTKMAASEKKVDPLKFWPRWHRWCPFLFFVYWTHISWAMVHLVGFLRSNFLLGGDT